MILTDRTLTVNGNSATLDSNIYLYRGDRNVELNFSIVNSKYRFTKKATDNIIESSEAFYSIVKLVAPNGEDIVFPATPIENGLAKWVIEGDLIDELDEVGKYDFQVRLLDSDQTSIITMPPIYGQVEVLEPLFGDINSLAGQDVTGKARTSVLSATQRPTLNSDGTYNKKEWVKQEIIYETDLNTLEDIASKNRQSILDINKEFLSTSESKEGSYLTFSNAKDGVITDIEVLGNTVQSSSNLSDIQSVGELQEDGRYKLSILSCSKNLFDGRIETLGKYYNYDGSILNCATSDGGTYSLKIKPNTQYKFSNCQSNITFWDKDLKFISGRWDATSVITSPENAMYVRVLVQGTKLNTIQIEEGTVATSYEPYQENKTSILLPCPLEKVGDVSDRLFRREDGVWCIEKNIETIIFNGSENWNATGGGGHATLNTFETEINPAILTNGITRKLHHVSNQFKPYMGSPAGIPTQEDYLGITNDDQANFGTFFTTTISTSKVPYRDLTSFKKYLSENNLIVKVEVNPQIIELPLDTQIQLNSFNGVTNIFTEDSPIEPTIKATVPKSLGASVNSLVNKTDILSDRVEKISSLQKGNEMEVSTDKKSVVVQSTNEGYVTDFNIKGDTLVNLVLQPQKSIVNTTPKSGGIFKSVSMLEIGKTYTICCDLVTKGTGIDGQAVRLWYTDETFVELIKDSSQLENYQGSYIKTFVPTKQPKNNIQLAWARSSSPDDCEITINNLVILEGDYTDKDISYFEGLKSVGDGTDKIESSVYNTGNMVDLDDITEGYYINKSNVKNAESNSFYCNKLVPIHSDMQIALLNTDGSSQVGIFRYLDEHQEFISGEEVSTTKKYLTIPSNAKYLGISFFDRLNLKDTFYVGIGDKKLDLKYKHQTKELLYKNAEGVWEKPVLRKVSDSVWDSIELHSDGKYYYHKRCGEVVLNGSEEWTEVLNDSNYCYFRTTNIGIIKYQNSQKPDLVSNAFNSETNTIASTLIKECITSGNVADQLNIVISTSKANSIDSFKTWLSQNPTTVVYELATEEVFECTDLSLNAYDGETFLSLETGYINPQYSCNVSAHIGNVVSQIKEKTDTLEEKVGELLDDRTKAYETDKGYLVVEDTSDGQVEELKVEGNTLVNLATLKSGGFSYSSGSSKQIYTGLRRKLIPGKYTLITTITENTLDKGVSLSLSTVSSGIQYPGIGFTQGVVGVQIKLLNITTETTNIRLYTDNTTTGQVNFDNIIVLEGDHTQNPPSYFEGLKSVGDTSDKIEVLSNNFKGALNSKIPVENGYFKLNGYVDTSHGEQGSAVLFSKCCFKTGEKFSIEARGQKTTYFTKVVLYNSILKTKKEVLSLENNILTSNSFVLDKDYDIIFVDTGDVSAYGFLDINSLKINGRKYKQNKKQILFKNSSGVYEKPVLRSTGTVSDTIEKHSDGKYYFHKRCGKVVFDGSSDEGWVKNPDEVWHTETHITFRVIIANMFKNLFGNDSVAICDRFKTIKATTSNYDMSDEFTSTDATYFNVKILKTKLSSQDVTGFKAWLQSNPVTAVYQLATEEVYEVVNLDLDSYEGETSVIVDGGAISPKLTFKIASHIANTIQVLKDRINYLENKVMDMFKAVLSGDVQTLAYELYPEDFENSTHTETVEGTDLL